MAKVNLKSISSFVCTSFDFRVKRLHDDKYKAKILHVHSFIYSYITQIRILHTSFQISAHFWYVIICYVFNRKKWRLLQKFSFTNLKFVILVQQNSYLLIHRVSQVTLVLYISIHVTKRKIFSSRDCFERHNLWRCSLLYKKMFILKWSLTNFQAITMQKT